MRLIIVEDRLQVLKRIKIMLKDLSDSIELIMVYCNTWDEAVDFPIEEGWYSVKTEDALYKVCEEELEIHNDDHYLLDITLFQETQIDKRFNDYISVKLAHYLEDKGSKEGIKIKFYTHPRGISLNDFARETVNWGKPIYRPKLDDNSDEEQAAQKIFVQKIKEYCNV